MWGEGERFTESIARTDKLYCSDCKSKIKKGDKVIFRLYEERMKDAYCELCGDTYEYEVVMDGQYCFDI